MSKRIMRAGLFTLIAAVLFACGDAPQAKTGEIAPDFVLRDQSGKRVRLSDYKNQYVHITIAATWCGYCRKQARYMGAVERELSKKNFAHIMVLFDAGRDGHRAWAKKYGLSKVLNDTDKNVARKLGARGVPANILLRPGLRIAARWSGAYPNKRDFMSVLRRRLPGLFAGG